MAEISKTNKKGLNLPEHYDPSFDKLKENMTIIDELLQKSVPNDVIDETSISEQETNINNLLTTGRYYTHPTATGTPENSVGIIDVFRANQCVRQEWRAVTNQTFSYIRLGYIINSTEIYWESWNTAWGNSNDGAGSGLDADLVDGIHGTSFYRKDLETTAFNSATSEGKYRITTSVNAPCTGTTNWICLVYYNNSSNYLYQIAMEYNDKSNTSVSGGTSTSYTHNVPLIYVRKRYNGTWYSWQVLWNSGNSGHNSGLNADMLDGVHSDGFYRVFSELPTFETATSEGEYKISSGDVNSPNPYEDKWICLVYRDSSSIIQTAIGKSFGLAYSRFKPIDNSQPWSDWQAINSPLKTISGNSSIQLSDCAKDTPIVDYKIYGNSIQKVNLLPYPYVSTTKTEYGITFTDNGDGTVTANGNGEAFSIFTLCESMTLGAGTYTVSGCPSGGSASTYYMTISYSGYSGVVLDNYTFTLSADTAVTISIGVLSGTTADNLVFKPQISIGSAVTEYTKGKSPSPDFPSEIQSVGDLVTDETSEYYGKYEVSIINKPFNIFDGNREYDLTSTYNDTPDSLYQFIKAGHTYTMFAYIDNTNGTTGATLRMSIGKRVDGVNSWNYISTNAIGYGTMGYAIGTFTVTNDYNNQLNFQFTCRGSSVIYKDVMVVEGTYTAEELKDKYIEYTYLILVNIYLDEPLRKVGDYADYIDFKNQRVVRQVEVLDDTGTKTIDESFRYVSPPIEEKILVPTLKSVDLYNTNINISTSISPSMVNVNYLTPPFSDFGDLFDKCPHIVEHGGTLDNPLVLYDKYSYSKNGESFVYVDKGYYKVYSNSEVFSAPALIHIAHISSDIYPTITILGSGKIYTYFMRDDDESIRMSYTSIRASNALYADYLTSGSLTISPEKIVTHDVKNHFIETDNSASVYLYVDTDNLIGEGANVDYGITQVYYTGSKYSRIAVSMSSGKVYRQTSGTVAWSEITPKIDVLTSDPQYASNGQVWVVTS